MTTRTVSVHLRAKFGEYLAAQAAGEKATKAHRQEVERLNRAGSAFTRSGLLMGLASVPSLAAPAAAAVGAIPALALSGAAALGTLMVATNGVGTAMKAVAEGDTDKFDEAMAGLSEDAREFVRAYEQVKPVLDDLGNRTQDPFFHELNKSLDTLTGAYLPVLLQQMPKVSKALGDAAQDYAMWASGSRVVGQVNRQFELGADIVGDYGQLLRSGTALLLDMADVGGEFARELVQGATRGTDAFRRWLQTAEATGRINDLLDNSKRIISAVTDVAAEAGDVLFDAMANPALADGAETLLDVAGLLLQMVHGLVSAFELLPPGMQSFVATSVAVGAAVLILTGRIMALKASLESAKASAITTGAALKSVGAFMAGPWGIALTTATIALTIFADGNAEAEAKVAELRDTLDEQTGAFTGSTRAMVVNRLEQEGVLRAARNMGLDLGLVTDAALGNADAIWTLNNQLAAMPSYANTEKITDGIGGMNNALTESQAQWQRERDAMRAAGDEVDTTTGAFVRQERAVKSLGDALRAQADPAFALIKAQKDMASAQLAYTKAVDKHGAKSKEAEAAALNLAQQSIELADAVDEAGKTFDGKLSPELEAAMRAAGLTNEQIGILKKALQDAKVAGDAFAGAYTATVTAPGIDAILAKLERLRYLAKKANVNINAYDPEGLATNRRWGGITTHARDGLLRNAGVYPAVARGARYAFAERETGGEAFVPRLGDPSRSLAILNEAAGWYGHSITPHGGTVAISTTQTIVYDHRYTLTVNGTGLLASLRAEIDLRGGDVQKVLGSKR